MAVKSTMDFNNLLVEVFKILKSDKQGFYLLVSFGLLLVILEIASIGVFVPILIFFFKSKDLILDNELLKIVKLVNEDNFFIFFISIIFVFYKWGYICVSPFLF